MKYRKKLAVIEAFQMTKKRRWDKSKWPNWLHEAWQEGSLWTDPNAVIAEGRESPTTLFCGHGKGIYRINWGDWIVKGTKNKLRACSPYMFTDVYEPVEELVEERQ